MRMPWRERFGIWLERVKPLRPLLLEFSHEYPEGRKHYVNRISHTLVSDEVRP